MRWGGRKLGGDERRLGAGPRVVWPVLRGGYLGFWRGFPEVGFVLVENLRLSTDQFQDLAFLQVDYLRLFTLTTFEATFVFQVIIGALF